MRATVEAATDPACGETRERAGAIDARGVRGDASNVVIPPASSPRCAEFGERCCRPEGLLFQAGIMRASREASRASDRWWWSLSVRRLAQELDRHVCSSMRLGMTMATAGCVQAGKWVGSAGGTSCRRSWDRYPLSGSRRRDGRRCTRKCRSSPPSTRADDVATFAGRSSSTSQVYLIMTVGTHQPPCHHSSVPRRSHGRALSAGAANVRQPIRGLNLLLRRPPDRPTPTVRNGLEPQRTTQDSTQYLWGSRVACRGQRRYFSGALL